MAPQIQELIENVFTERLQSRINPHFLYNSMGFIINMTKLDYKKAAILMAQNISEYYRYTTRLENSAAKLKEEIQLIFNF